MIITKNLVILNLPKTGSSFVRKVVKKIFINRRNKNFISKALNKLRIKSIGFKEIMTDHPSIPDYKDQHGCYDQIPNKDKNKTILSVVRDPYARLESYYKFRWWVKHPPIDKKQIEESFTDFPHLTFSQYLKMNVLANEKLKSQYGIDNDLKIGRQSIQFIRFFFKNHKSVLSSLKKENIINGSFMKDFCDVTFIRNENLNEELVSFLTMHGYSEKETNFILNHKKVNVTKNNINESFLSQELIDHVNEYEWILFEILSSLGINYKID